MTDDSSPVRPRQENAPQTDERAQMKVFQRLRRIRLAEFRWLEITNSVIAIVMVAVAFATYRVASDTTDLKSAIAKMAELVAQTRKEAVAAEKTASASQLQLAELHDEQRPWVYIDRIEVAHAITMQQWGIDIPLHIVLRNIGRTPAFAVSVSTDVQASWTGNIEGVDETALCERSKGPGIGASIFPNQTLDYYRSADVGLDTLEVFRKTNTQSEFATYVVLCITYRRNGEKNEHHLPYRYWVIEQTSGGQRNMFFRGSPIPSEKVRLEEWPTSSDTPD